MNLKYIYNNKYARTMKTSRQLPPEDERRPTVESLATRSEAQSKDDVRHNCGLTVIL